jgi:hypothetical protein
MRLLQSSHGSKTVNFHVEKRPLPEKSPMDCEDDDTLVFSLSAHTFLSSTPWPYINQPKAYHTIISINITWTEWPDNWNMQVPQISYMKFTFNPLRMTLFMHFLNMKISMSILLHHMHRIAPHSTLTYMAVTFGSLWDGRFMREWSLKFDVCNQKCNISIFK